MMSTPSSDGRVAPYRGGDGRKGTVTRTMARTIAPGPVGGGRRGPRTSLTARALRAIVATSAVLALAGCGLQIPAGSLERITGGQVRVGIAAGTVPGAPEAGGGPASGMLVAALEDFAQSRDARLVWSAGGEEHLVDQLEAGELDLAVGDMTDQTPWADRVSVTRGYAVDGSEQAYVVLLPLGENALQSALETFLDQRMAQ